MIATYRHLTSTPNLTEACDGLHTEMLNDTLLCRLHSFNTGNGTGLRYHVRYHEELPLQGGGKCAWDQREPE